MLDWEMLVIRPPQSTARHSPASTTSRARRAAQSIAVVTRSITIARKRP